MKSHGYALINIRIYFSSAPAASGVLTLTVALTKATLGIRWRVTGRVLTAMLAYDGFIAYTVCVFYNFIASLMRLSLSFTTF